MRLIRKHRRTKFLNAFHCCVCMLLGQVQIAGAERNTGEQQLRQHCLTCEIQLVKRLECAEAMVARFKQPAFIEENEGLIKINQGGPGLILLFDEYISSFSKQL